MKISLCSWTSVLGPNLTFIYTDLDYIPEVFFFQCLQYKSSNNINHS